MDSRTDALQIYRQAIAAVRADVLVRTNVHLERSTIHFGQSVYDLDNFDRIRVVGAGKASAEMALAMESILGNRLTDGFVVTKDGHSTPTAVVQLVEAAHPVPDQRSLQAGHKVIQFLEDSTERDLVFCLISGGASSLMEALPSEISLNDLQATTSLLLGSGADIQELNSVRACLSKIKAGGLARAGSPAKLICLVISDVMGNSLEVIGSGPCAAIQPDPACALKVLAKRDIENRVPGAVLDYLQKLKPKEQQTTEAVHLVIGDLATAVRAAKSEAECLGYTTEITTTELVGEARVRGRELAEEAANDRDSHPRCRIAAGETTVTISGNGKGGRCQEMALAAAVELEGKPGITMLFGGTDGTDGPTDAAGAMVDGETARFIRKSGTNIEAALSDNNSYPCLDQVGSLIRTGPTQTNVGDLVITVISGS